MLLRHMMEHVKTQNWMAVALDFLIVVSGVFIGLQVSNWNDARAADRDYDEAITRFQAELQANIDNLVLINKEAAQAMTIAADGFAALKTCNETSENRKTVERGLLAVSGTYGASIRDEALRQLLENDRLIAQQSDETRRQLADVAYTIRILSRELDFLEVIPLRTQVHESSIVKIGDVSMRTVTYHGEDFSRPTFHLGLATSLEEACKDDMLTNHFYSWIRWQGVLPVVANILTEKFEETLDHIEEETTS